MSEYGRLGAPTRVLACLVVAGGGMFFQAMPVFAQPGELLQLTQTIALPDVRGRIDHLDIDLDGGRLFVAALGNNTVEVVDLRAERRSARLEHLREPQGVAYVPEASRLFVASGASGRVDVFAGNTLSPVGHVDALEDADNVRYEPASGRLYVGYGSALAVLEAPTMRTVSRIKLAGHPESFQVEGSGSRIFVNVPNAQQIAVVDRKQGSVVATWDLGEMRANFPMALDELKHRLFVATRRPAALLVFDTESGKRIASVPIGGDADDLFFDGERKQLYAVCGEGLITVVQQQDADRYVAVGQVRTAPGARTGLFVPSKGMLYVAVPVQPSAPAEIRVYAVK
jgi:DNA-binding beta-propeller fold protein YncE